MATDEKAHLQKLAVEFIIKNRTASISTSDKTGTPHIAIVYCIVHDDLAVYFTTRAEGRKFGNLVDNPAVAMVFSGFKNLQQLQLRGKAERVRDQALELDLLHELMKLRFEDQTLDRPRVNLLEPGVRSEYAIFKVTPTEMTYADFETSTVGRYKPDFKKII